MSCVALCCVGHQSVILEPLAVASKLNLGHYTVNLKIVIPALSLKNCALLCFSVFSWLFECSGPYSHFSVVGIYTLPLLLSFQYFKYCCWYFCLIF